MYIAHEYVGPLPNAMQEVTVFAAGIMFDAPQPQVARARVRHLASPENAEAIRKVGMLPMQ